MTNGNFKLTDDDEVQVVKKPKAVKKATKTISRGKNKSTLVQNKEEELLSFNLLVQKIRRKHMINAIISDDPDKREKGT